MDSRLHSHIPVHANNNSQHFIIYSQQKQNIYSQQKQNILFQSAFSKYIILVILLIMFIPVYLTVLVYNSYQS